MAAWKFDAADIVHYKADEEFEFFSISAIKLSEDNMKKAEGAVIPDVPDLEGVDELDAMKGTYTLSGYPEKTIKEGEGQIVTADTMFSNTGEC